MRLNESGFTILELVAVLFIMALVASMSLPLLAPVLEDIRLKSDANRLAAALRTARQEAVSTGQPEGIYFYPFGNYYQVRGGVVHFLQKGIKFDGTTSFGPAYSSGPPACIFSASGAPRPRAGTAVLANDHGDRLYVIVNPAVGRVRVSETPPSSWSD